MSHADIFRLSLPRQQCKTPISTTPGTVLGWRKNGMPIFPIAGGSEPHGDQTGGTNDQQQTGGTNDQQQQAAGPAEAKDENGVALGFPEATKVEDMTPVQQAAYWRNQSKVQQRRVPANLTQLEQDAAAWAEYQRTQQTPADQALAAARTEAATAARKEAAQESALALLRISLHNRGKTDAEIDELVEFVSPDRFLTSDSKLDTAKVTTYVDKLVPAPVRGADGRPIGQGRYEQVPSDRTAAGKTEAERRGFTAPKTKSSLLPK